MSEIEQKVALSLEQQIEEEGALFTALERRRRSECQAAYTSSDPLSGAWDRASGQQQSYLLLATSQQVLFQILAESIPQLVWIITPAGRVLYTNEQWVAYTGLSISQVQQLGWADCVHVEDRPRSLAAWLKHAQHGCAYQLEQRLRRASDGIYRWQQMRAFPVKDEAGNILIWIAICTDIEERKRLEQEAERRERFYRMLANASPHGAWLTESDGRIVFRNRVWSRYTGLPSEADGGADWTSVIHEEDRPEVARRWAQSLKTGKAFEHIYRVRRASDGAYHWHLVHILLIQDEQGESSYWFGSSTDIEECKQLELALLQSEENFRLLAEEIPQPVWVASLNGHIEYGNAQLSSDTGLTLTQMQNLGWLECIHPEDRAYCYEAWKQAEATKTGYELEYRIRRAVDGVYRWHLGRMAIQQNSKGTAKWIGTCTDIEDQKRIQEEALRLMSREQATRVEVEKINQMLRNFMSIVSHEFRTTLTGIQGFSDLLRQDEYPQEVREFASDIYSDALRLNRMINDLLDLEKMQAGRMNLVLEPVNLNVLIRKEVERMKLVAPAYNFHLSLAEGLRMLPVDPDKMIQVLTNLLANAVKYSPDCQDIDIATEQKADQIHFWIRDGGLGIPGDALEKIFHPYQRAHSERAHFISGTGLGLPIARQIIELHGGKIWAESTPGGGSTFHFTLPCAS